MMMEKIHSMSENWGIPIFCLLGVYFFRQIDYKNVYLLFSFLLAAYISAQQHGRIVDQKNLRSISRGEQALIALLSIVKNVFCGWFFAIIVLNTITLF